MKYKVLSRRLVGFEQGATLGDDDLVGCNVGMLVEAGHLQVVSSKAVKAAASAEADEAEPQED